MSIPSHIKEVIERLYSNQYLGSKEIESLERWLGYTESDAESDAWLARNWELSENSEIAISFDEIRVRIKKHGRRLKLRQLRQFSAVMQKIAAILVLPLLILSIWLMIHRQSSSVMMLATAKGERTHVVLPDGSEVWLNVSSKLEYSTDYNARNRAVRLNGEAFFKVAKGKKYPFTVDTKEFRVKALGTQFNISAYDDEPRTSAFLKEGLVEFSYSFDNAKKQKLRMNPGEQATINPTSKFFNISKVNSENIIRWFEGELYFENEPFDQVFRKIERWYNVKIQYSLAAFEKETFTVNLKKGESIERLFQIMDEAIGVKITRNVDEYIITRK